MQLLKYIPLQLTCYLILGIIAGYYLEISVATISIFTLSSAVVLVLCYILCKRTTSSSIYFIWSTFLVFFCIGILAITIKNDLNKKQHFTSYISEGKPQKL